MGQQHFDFLTSALGTVHSRRHALLTSVSGLMLGVPYAAGKGRKGKRRKKVTLCHNGQTIRVAKKRKRQHLQHGDTRGACPDCDVCASGCAFTSLYAAIDAANPGDTIRLCPETYVVDRDTFGTFYIDKNLTLLGAGTDRTILDGGRQGLRVFEIDAETVVVRDLTVTRGQEVVALGGGILVLAGSALTLDGVLVTGNEALDAPGGGILNSGTLTLIGSTVTANTAVGAGGGIFNAGTLFLEEGSRVTGNIPDDCGGTPPETGTCG